MAAPSDIFLKWENHNDALASYLYSQLEKENFLDVTIAAEGKCINAHRLVLCASSPYFENLLGRLDKPAVVILQNIKFCDVQSIIEYIYKGEISLPSNQLGSFLEAAKNLQIKGLTEGRNNPGHVQEPIMAVEMPTGSQLTAPNRPRPTREAAELADDPIQAMLLETEENFNQPEEEQDVVIVDAPPRPAPVMINLDETLIEDNEEDEMDSDSDSNASVEDDSSSRSDSSSVDRQLRPKANGNGLASRLCSCGACGRNFFNKTALNRHTVRGNCQTVSYFRCELCGVCRRRRCQVRAHVSRVHRNLSPSQYDAHIMEIKATLPKFACNLCSHRSENRSSLRMHQMRGHVGKSQARHSFMGV